MKMFNIILIIFYKGDNMEKKERLKMINFLSDILSKSNISDFKHIELENDKDVNFLISPKIKYKNKEENIQLQLMIYCSDNESLSIYCPLLYKLLDKDSLVYTLSSINEVNSKVAIGKIYMNKDNNSVISYIYRALFNNIYEELTPQLINDYIDAFLLASIEFYSKMKEVVNEDK